MPGKWNVKCEKWKSGKVENAFAFDFNTIAFIPAATKGLHMPWLPQRVRPARILRRRDGAMSRRYLQEKWLALWSEQIGCFGYDDKFDWQRKHFHCFSFPAQAIASRATAPRWHCSARPFGATAALRPIASATNSSTRRARLTVTAGATPTITTSNAIQSKCWTVL